MDAELHERTATRISGLVARLLEKRGAGRVVSREQNLKDAGLTSLDMVNLMLAVEGEFDIFVPQEQMTPENFRSIAAIEALVDGLAPPN
jgi:acyl carrier protein